MPRLGALAPFRFRSYRFQWPADLLTSWAFEMETLILGWYVLVETDSVLMLTLFGALLYCGTLIAPMVGVWSDRFGHRNILSGMRAIYGLVSGTLMVLAFTGTLRPSIVLVLSRLPEAVCSTKRRLAVEVSRLRATRSVRHWLPELPGV